MADILIDNQAFPATPAAGKSVLYVDSTTKRPISVDDGGNLRGTFLSGNDSTASQTLGAANTYVTNSGILIPSMGMKAGMLFRWYIFYTKTAASTATVAYTVVTGATQTTSDTVRATLTSVAQTAVVDGGLFIFCCHVRNVGGSGVVAFNYSISGKVAANAVGFGSSALDVVSGTFDNSAMAGQYVGLCINPGASSVWTSTMVEAKLTG
jgi:hypothetical protein